MHNTYYSIIIPLYNKESYISKAISSVLSQTYTKFELIVVDDGSTDNSCKVVESFTDARIKLIKKNNGGASSARNYGIQAAQYKYIAFLDADDYWEISFLEKIHKLIVFYPEAKMYGTAYGEIVKSKIFPAKTCSLLSSQYTGYIDYISIFSKKIVNPVNSSAVVIERSVFNDGLEFNEKIKSGEDLLVWLAIAFKYKIAYINEILSFYNHDVTGNLTGHLCPWNNYFLSCLKDSLVIDSKAKKYLIDALILRCLRPYYAFKLCPSQCKDLLNNVSFKGQGVFHFLFYKVFPLSFISLFYQKLYQFRKR